MAKTAYAARRHIQAWGNFFDDVQFASREAIEEFIHTHQRNKHLRQSFKRLVVSGIVERKQNKFLVTPRGALFFLRRKPIQQIKKRWDGKWRLISFDVPVRDDRKRALLREFLKEFGFLQLQKSVWVCPNYLTEQFWKLVTSYELDVYCKTMLVEIIEGDHELKKHFEL